MPLVQNTQNSIVRAANTAMARAFFPRFKASLYKDCAGSYISTALVEPHAILGTVPGLQLYSGGLRFPILPSFTLQVPNLLFKNGLEIARTEYEADQTGTMINLAPQFGVRLAEFSDQLFVKRLIAGATSGSQTVVFGGATYTMTMDGLPFFSTTHTDWYSGGTQSNIIQGQLPSTKVAVAAQSIATSALQMQQDLLTVMDRISSVRDNQGIAFFPTIEPGQSIILLVPRILQPIADLAFTRPGTIISNTSNITPQYVKAVKSSGYLSGNFVDPETNVIISPVNETEYYVLIVDDFVKPFYLQMFRPPKKDELFPPDYDAGAEIDRLMASRSTVPVDVDSATAFASSMVETTFNKQGANADAFTITKEAFVMSARWRGNFAYGPWFTAYKVIPAGGS